jgi:hypothetical protein
MPSTSSETPMRTNYSASLSRNQIELYGKLYSKLNIVYKYSHESRKMGSGVSQEQHDDMNRRLETFKNCFLEEYMKIENQDTIVVLPISGVNPNYRDEYPGLPKSQAARGLRTTYLSPYIGAPEITIPSKCVHLQQCSSNNSP